MAKTHFQKVLQDKLEQAIETRARALASGAAQDYAQYKFEVGFIAGLEAAGHLSDETERGMEL